MPLLSYACLQVCTSEMKIWRRLDVLADCGLLSVLLYAGAIGQVQVEESNAAANFLQGILASMTLNRAMLPLKTKPG